MIKATAIARFWRIAAVALLGTTASALTAPAMAAQTTPVAAKIVTSTVSAASLAERSERRICVVDSFTGSRVPRKVCRTAKEWRLAGEEVGRR